ncbi:MAG: hypothetical protein RLZZ383_2094, partial [Pseudomonadota bacterium]
DVEKIVAGHEVYICSDCIRLCRDILHEGGPGRASVAWSKDDLPTPADIKGFLDQYMIGQHTAKRRIAVAVYNHYKRLQANASDKKGDVEIQKSNVLLIGPTGTGKTLIAQSLARFLDVPFVVADATTLTEAGYVGEDVENMVAALYQAAGQNVERAQRGIIYVDEIDKLARKGPTGSVSRDVSGEGVQQALLKILEGTVASIQSKSKARGAQGDNITIDTTNILFICGGSFEGLPKIIGSRLGKRSVGFQREADASSSRPAPKGNGQDDLALLSSVTSEDLTKFGLIPEFMGRLPVMAVLDPLGVDDLVHVLTEPKNSLVKQYQRLLKSEKVKLTFTDEALRAIAELAIKRRSGARGLRAIMERVMLDVMFDVPSRSDVRVVTITAQTVHGEAPAQYTASAELGGVS